ncbi:Spy/CpxP family protein refolding chaperone [Microbulbifer agarilyticus]|uniref:Spy/CpxP family protein refolding chaperone n=1 Tax=Microbulbifer agarilyticus TaxID=260552 RepID=UPI001CD58849|nr:Spy/CpxP family protein refolding chaperone [Microbulbifer agarilyticus]MCA0900618.1 Spy/CpxP family protein refolding chaperone [Microbulbifer agarilyticus]
MKHLVINKWKALAGTVVLGGALAASGLVMAFPEGDRGHGYHKASHHKGGDHYERMFDRLAEKLELTEGQKAQVKANRDAGKEAREADRKAMHEVRKQLKEAIDSGADQATLNSLGTKLGELEVRKMQRRVEMHKQFEAILTDDQRAKMEQMKAERKARWEQRKERRANKQSD